MEAAVKDSLLAGGTVVGLHTAQSACRLRLAGLEALIPPFTKNAFSAMAPSAAAPNASACPFRLAVINDEITQDFEKAVRSCPAISGCSGLSCVRCGTRT